MAWRSRTSGSMRVVFERDIARSYRRSSILTSINIAPRIAASPFPPAIRTGGPPMLDQDAIHDAVRARYGEAARIAAGLTGSPAPASCCGPAGTADLAGVPG